MTSRQELPASKDYVQKHQQVVRGSSEPSGLTLGLEQSQDVTLPDGALDVADQVPFSVVEEQNLDLGDATARSYE